MRKYIILGPGPALTPARMRGSGPVTARRFREGSRAFPRPGPRFRAKSHNRLFPYGPKAHLQSTDLNLKPRLFWNKHPPTMYEMTPDDSSRAAHWKDLRKVSMLVFSGCRQYSKNSKRCLNHCNIIETVLNRGCRMRCSNILST